MTRQTRKCDPNKLPARRQVTDPLRIATAVLTGAATGMLLGFSAPYLLMAAAYWDTSPAVWDPGARLFVALLGFVAGPSCALFLAGVGYALTYTPSSESDEEGAG